MNINSIQNKFLKDYKTTLEQANSKPDQNSFKDILEKTLEASLSQPEPKTTQDELANKLNKASTSAKLALESAKAKKALNTSLQAKGTELLLDAMNEDAKEASSLIDFSHKQASNYLNAANLKTISNAIKDAKNIAQNSDQIASSEQINSRFSPAELKRLKEQTDAFESFFIKAMLDVSMPKHSGTLFGKDAGDEIYSDMYNDAISRALSGGMGLSTLLYEYLSQS